MGSVLAKDACNKQETGYENSNDKLSVAYSIRRSVGNYLESLSFIRCPKLIHHFKIKIWSGIGVIHTFKSSDSTFQYQQSPENKTSRLFCEISSSILC